MKLRPYINIMTIALPAVLMSACEDVKPYGVLFGEECVITTSSTSVTLDDFGKGSISVYAKEGNPWYVYNSAHDISFQNDNHYYYGRGSETLSIEAGENADSVSKTIRVDIDNYWYSSQGTSFNVIQPGTYISCNPTKASFAGNGASVTMTVKSNADWELMTPSWITATPNKGSRGQSVSVRLTADKNSSTRDRSNNLTFTTAKDLKFYTTASQYGADPELSLSQTNMSFTYGGGSASSNYVSVTTNAPSWTLGAIDYQTDASDKWISISKYSTSFYVYADANDHIYSRTATVTVTAAGKTAKLNISQEAAPERLSLSPSYSITFLANGNVSGYTSSYQNVSVDTNLDSWSVSSNRSWLKVTKYYSYFSISVDTYTGTTSDRTGTITVTAGNKTATIDVTQKAKTDNNIVRDGYGNDKSLD